MSAKPVQKKCPCCDEPFIGHPNKKFCGQRCKDRWHNATNPRGYQHGAFEPHYPKTNSELERDAGLNDLEAGWDGHKNAW